MANPMIEDLVSRLEDEVTLAIEHKNGKGTNDEEKIPLRHQVIGNAGKNLSVYLTDDEFKAIGFNAKQIEAARSIGSAMRQWFVNEYGETSGGFDSKRGTSIVQSLKQFVTMSETGVMDLDPADAAAIETVTQEWYNNAPLRGKAAAKRNREQEAADVS